MKPSFAFFGSPPFAVTILQSLLDQGWLPELVITEPPKPVGRSKQLTPTAVAQFAASQGLPIETPSSTEFTQVTYSLKSLDLFIVAAYGKIFPAELLTFPKHGAINVHASLLPRWRGASPIQATILAGDQETGITFMQMEAGLDTGPILSQHSVDVESDETTGTLTNKLARTAADSIVPALASYLSHPSNRSYLKLQPSDGVTYAPKLTKQDGQVRLAALTPTTLDRAMRALQPWPGVYTDEFETRLLLRDGLLADDTYVITSLQWAGKSVTDGVTFARAYPDVLTALPTGVTLGANK